MSKYPLIEKMGLRIFPANSISKTYVDCEALEAVLAKAHVIYSTREPENGSAKWDEGYKISHTHQALLICVEEIKKEPVKIETTVDEIKEACRTHGVDEKSMNALIKYFTPEIP